MASVRNPGIGLRHYVVACDRATRQSCALHRAPAGVQQDKSTTRRVKNGLQLAGHRIRAAACANDVQVSCEVKLTSREAVLVLTMFTSREVLKGSREMTPRLHHVMYNIASREIKTLQVPDAGRRGGYTGSHCLGQPVHLRSHGGSVFGGHQQSLCRVSSHVAMIISREAEIASRETILWSLFRSGASDFFTFRTTQPGSTSTRND